jgi:uncharacterized protein (TIGR03435 family)
MNSRNSRFAIAALAFLCAAAICAQTQKPQAQNAKTSAFEVASVKRNSDSGPPGDIPTNSESSPGHFTMRDKPLRYILEWAYDLKDFQIVGPEWIKMDDRFDIVANAPGPATNDQMRPMLQTLLTDRFQMKSHFEKREMSVYALVPGKGEPKLTKTDPNAPQTINGGAAGGAQFHNFPLSRLTFLLTRRMDRPVLDLTGISGNFDYTVDISGLGRGMGSSGYDGEGRSVFQAIQEDMGLKLEPRKWPVDVLVIDSVSKVPTEN